LRRAPCRLERGAADRDHQEINRGIDSGRPLVKRRTSV
jgi:hypothetical protein